MSARRILVVDDHADVANVVCILLSMFGHECRAATTGRAALNEVTRWQPDIAIIDIGLPDISGYEIARELRARAGGRPLHLAAVTGSGDREEALEAGFDQHVTKPTDLVKLEAILAAAEPRVTSVDAQGIPDEPAAAPLSASTDASDRG